MKLKRITPLIALVIAAILCFTSCSGSNKTTVTELNNGERLDLDYIENGNTSQAEPEATERPWYAFLTDAFSFGTTNKGSTKAAAQPTSTPDSVRELYEQGDAPTERPEKNAKPTDASNTEATPFVPPIETQEPGANGTNTPEPSATPAPTPVPTAEPAATAVPADTATNKQSDSTKTLLLLAVVAALGLGGACVFLLLKQKKASPQPSTEIYLEDEAEEEGEHSEDTP